MTEPTDVADPDVAPQPQRSRREINIVFGTIMLGMLLSALDGTIVSTALPTIVAELGNAEHVSWVVTSYLLTNTIATMLAGKFGDLYGRKLIFQLSAGLFVGASAMCGLANSMEWLVGWRAVQGIGAGGLVVTATAIIGDIVPMRDRGKYQGALGAVFGVSTVIGPLLGGLLTDNFSWRWCFFVNLPIGILVILLAARTMPTMPSTARPVLDYAGIAAIAVGAGGLTLALSLGGAEYAWDSAVILGLLAAAVLGTIAFVFAERRAVEPMMPLRLFANPVFTVSVMLSFVVGFAMLGAMTFLPTYMQYVHGVSATSSGVRMLPMVVGMLGASIGAGTIVGRTGVYKRFPVVGTVLISLGLLLMSRMGPDTSFWLVSAYIFIFGVGLGLSMQILTIIVQNTCAYRDLGVATSGVTFFRALGSTVGAAAFGSVYSNRLTTVLPPALVESGLPPEAIASPAALHSQPADVIAPVVNAYAETLQTVFLWAVPVGMLGFVISLFLKEVPLRDMVKADAADVGDGFGMAEPADSRLALETSIARLMVREGNHSMPQIRVASGTRLDGASAWCVAQVYMRGRRGMPTDVAAIATGTNVPGSVLLPAFDQAQGAGFLAGDEADGSLSLTPAGAAEWRVFSEGLKDWLAVRLQSRGADDRAALDAAMSRFASSLLAEETVAEARSPMMVVAAGGPDEGGRQASP